MKTNAFKLSIYLIIILGIGTALFLTFYQFPKKIDLVSPAVTYYENDPSSIEHTSIRISGVLNQPLFQQHVFKGSVTIDSLELTKSNTTLDTYVLDKKNGINSGNLAYHQSSKPGEIVTLSMIGFNNSFEDINIVSSWGQDENSSFFIVSGSSYEEAIDTQNRMREKYGENFVPKK